MVWDLGFSCFWTCCSEHLQSRLSKCILMCSPTFTISSFFIGFRCFGIWTNTSFKKGLHWLSYIAYFNKTWFDFIEADKMTFFRSNLKFEIFFLMGNPMEVLTADMKLALLLWAMIITRHWLQWDIRSCYQNNCTNRLSLGAAKFWPIFELDFKNAYLDGDFKERVYMTSLGYVVTNIMYVCWFSWSLHGLEQCSWAWFQKFQSRILKHWLKQSNCDHSLCLCKPLRACLYFWYILMIFWFLGMVWGWVLRQYQF